MSTKLQTLILSLGVLATAVVSAHPRKGSGGRLTVTAEEAASYTAAKAAFEKHCFRCHTKAGSKAKRKTLEHLSMDAYPFGGHHADDIGAAVRRTLGAGKNAKAATMPKDDPGVVTGDDLARILTWTEAFDRARAKPAKQR